MVSTRKRFKRMDAQDRSDRFVSEIMMNVCGVAGVAARH